MRGTRMINICTLNSSKNFEGMCLDLFKEALKCNNLQQHGRKGQRQQGVDIYGDINGEWHGIQCKSSESLTIKDIKKEINKAKNFNPPLARFIIATQTKRDANIQEDIRKKSNEHKQNGLFEIEIYYWEDISDFLYQHDDIWKKYYPDFFQNIYSDVSLSNKTIIANTSAIDKGNYIITEDGQSNRDHLENAHHSDLNDVRDSLNKNEIVRSKKILDNLKSNKWSRCSDSVKYRITTNYGALYFLQNEPKKAAEFLIEALAYQKDGKSLSNAALGHYLLENTDKARKLYKKCIENYPTYKEVYSVILLVESELKTKDELLDLIPSNCRKCPDIKRILSRVLYDKGLVNDALDYAKASYNLSKTPDHLVKENFAMLILDKVYKKSLRVGIKFFLDDEDAAEVERAESLYEEIINKDGNEEILKFHPLWFTNLMLLRLFLGKKEESLNILQDILKKFPDEIETKKNILNTLFHTGQVDQAIEILESTKELTSDPQYLIFLSSLFLRKNQQESYKKVYKYLDKAIANGALSEDQAIQEKQIRIKTLIKEKRFQEVKKMLENLKEQYPKNVLVLLEMADFKKELGRDEEENLLLDEAYRCVDFNSEKLHNIFAINALAERMYLKKKWNEAKELYKKTTNRIPSHPNINNLLNCYYILGEYDNAISLANSILETNSNSIFATELLVDTYNIIGDLEKAKNTCLDFLEKVPSNTFISLKLATIARRDGDEKLLKSIMSKDLNTESLTCDGMGFYAELMSLSGNYKKSIELRYECILKFRRDSKAHRNFILSMRIMPSEYLSSLCHGLIQINSSVTLDFENDDVKTYIITNDDLFENAISPEDKFAKKLLNKKIGDKIFVDRLSGKTSATVKEIKHKHLAACEHLSSNFHARFPEDKTFEIVPAKTKQDIDKTREVPKVNSKKVFEYYQKGAFTIERMAQCLGKKYIDMCKSLTQKENFSYLTSLGTYDELDFSIKSLEKSHIAVLDVSCLLTIHWLGIHDQVRSMFNEILIHQTVIDEFMSSLEELKRLQDSGCKVIDENQEKNIFDNIRSFESILNWVENHCKIEPIPKEIYIGQERKEESEDLIGLSSFNTILISKVEGRVFLSDDLNLRIFAMQQEGIRKSSNSIGILSTLISQEKMSRKDYNNKILDLVLLNFSWPPINSEILMIALERDGLIAGKTFRKCINFFDSSCDIILKSKVVCRFLIDTFRRPILPMKMESILIVFLNRIAHDNRFQEIKKLMIAYLELSLLASPLELNKIKTFITDWERNNYRL